MHRICNNTWPYVNVYFIQTNMFNNGHNNQGNMERTIEMEFKKNKYSPCHSTVVAMLPNKNKSLKKSADTATCDFI